MAAGHSPGRPLVQSRGTAADVARHAPTPSSTQVVLLGTGTPNADPDRSGPAVAVVVNDTPYLVDFGPGVVRRAAAAAAKGIEGLEVKRLRTAFLTHLHSDHTAGYPDLIFTPAVLERDAPLDVYGPPGLGRMTSRVLDAWRDDLAIRLRGLEPAKPIGYQVRAHEVRPGEVYRDANVSVRAFAVGHGSWRHALGYRFETKDRVVVVSGDCTPSESVVEACNGCDVLVHEVFSLAGLETRPPEWQRYHRAFHTSSHQLGELATRARPRLLVLYHQLQWGVSDDDLVAEVRSAFQGSVAYGRDLDVY
jgi:ribonuclease Z